ncbi:MAG: hypothetical protein QOF62_962 [Pyrinomonadaceae bacterium]|jgi:hypothetical protein|nr:hypothetical protein [Pyrinomonadaceae bacterium]
MQFSRTEFRCVPQSKSKTLSMWNLAEFGRGFRGLNVYSELS